MTIVNKTESPRTYGNDKVSVVVPANGSKKLVDRELGVLSIDKDKLLADVNDGLIAVSGA